MGYECILVLDHTQQSSPIKLTNQRKMASTEQMLTKAERRLEEVKTALQEFNKGPDEGLLLKKLRRNRKSLDEEDKQKKEAVEARNMLDSAIYQAEKMKSEMLEATHAQQAELLDRARRDIEAEKTKAIDELRREAIDLALAGAGKVIEKNLDDAQNRKLVESYLASIK